MSVGVGVRTATERVSSVRSRELGARLRAAMTAAGLTATQVTTRLGVSQSQVSRWLNGIFACREVDAAVFLAVCGVTDARERDAVLSLCAEHHLPGVFRVPGEQRWSIYRQHAGLAERLVEFAPVMVPWMLQVPEYTRALAVAGGVPAEQIAEWVCARAALASLIGRNGPATVVAVVHEWALRTPVGGAEVMAAQLRHLARVSMRPGVSLWIVPSNTGALPGVGGGFALLQTPGCRPAIYREDEHAGVFLDRVPDVTTHRDTLDRLTRAALDEKRSRDLLQTLARDLYAHHWAWADLTNAEGVA